jgi:CelD/BcsL family acetyltransferase involved in cellulose biosynthesis
VTETRVLTDAGDAAALEPAWRTLAERRGNAFVTPEWFRASLRGGGATPYVVAVLERGEPLGLLPLAAAGGRLRTLRFAGAAFGDRFEPVCAPGDEERVAAAAGSALASRRDWAVLALDHVDAGAAWTRALVAAGGLAAVRSGPAKPLPYAELGRGWDDYLRGRSRNLRSQLGRKLRALERDRDVRFRETDPARLAGDLDTLLALHDRRRAELGGSSLAGEPARALHREFAVAALERGWLRLWLLEVDGEPVAAWYGWSVGGRYAYYNAGFDPGFGDASVGLLLLARTVRAAAEEGAAEYDLLLGGEAFKYRFATGERWVESLVVTRRLHPARALAITEGSLRRAAGRLPPAARARLRRAASAVVRRLPGSRGRA